MNNPKPTLEQRCKWSRRNFRIRNPEDPESFICTVKNPDCKHAGKKDECITVNYVKKPKETYFRCKYEKDK